MDKLNKYHLGHLHNTTPHDAYSIKIHVITLTLADISQEQNY